MEVETDMYCTGCGVELKAEDCFCSRCGRQTAAARETYVAPALMLDKRESKIAGVCAGLARHLQVDPILVRVIWLCVALLTGVGFVAYLAAWIVMPSDRYAYARPVMV